MATQHTFGDLLRRMRTAAGLTQEQLGKLATLSTQTVSTLERGTRSRPRRETVLLVATALGLSDADTERLLSASRDSGIQFAEPVPGGIPRTLPPSAGDFTGREPEATKLHELLRPTFGPDATAIGLVVISGMGGVGKTSLALHTAHQLAAMFPDGQLYVDLGGFGPNEPMSSVDAISVLLGAMGIPPNEVPTAPAAAVGRYRSLLAGKRMLLVLDNALDGRQVEPLLPTSPGSAAIVTSRRSIVVAGGKEIRLDAFREDEALAMLARTSGRQPDDEVDAAKDVVRYCGHLPLALRIIGARLAARPSWSMTAMRDRLADRHRQLDELDHQDLGVRRSLALSIEQLADSDDEWDQRAATAILLLPSAPGPDVSTEVAAAAIDETPALTERLLERLVDNALLTTHTPGRYRFHDLLRTYLHELAPSPGLSGSALARVLRLYARSAWQASHRTGSVDERLHWYDTATLGSEVLLLDDHATAHASDWLHAEWRNLTETVAMATHEHDALLVQLAIGLLYVDSASQTDVASLNRLAQKAASRLGDASALGILHHDAGVFSFESSHAEEGLEYFKTALDLFRDADDLTGQAMALRNLTQVYRIVGLLDASIAAGRDAVELHRRMTNPPKASLLHIYLGMAHGLNGDTRQELEHFNQAMTLVDQTPSGLRHRHIVYKQIGIAHRLAGRLDESARLLLMSVETAERTAQFTNMAIGLIELARTQLAQGRFAEALESTRLAREQARAAGVGSLEARGYHMAGQILDTQGRGEEANAQWQLARDLYYALGVSKAVAELDQLLTEPHQPDVNRHLFWYDGPPRHPNPN